MQPCYAGVPPYPEDSDDTATIVLPRLEDFAEEFPEDFPDDPREDFPMSAWSDATHVEQTAEQARYTDQQAEGTEQQAEGTDQQAEGTGQLPVARDNTAMSVRAALGAVVTGGLVASQFSGTVGLIDAGADASRTSTLTSSVASATVLAGPSEPDFVTEQRDIEQLHKGDDLIRQATAVHAATVRAAPARPIDPEAARMAAVLRGGGNLDDWISVALHKLNLHPAWAPAVKRIIMMESRGNPLAINRWDSNAMAGRPSQGLMQVIPSTYRRYVLPELAGRPITDPVANITAGIRYMLSNYGYLTLGRGGRYSSAGQYVGY